MNSAIDQQIEEAIDCALVEAVQSSVLRRVFSQLRRADRTSEFLHYRKVDWATIGDDEFVRMSTERALRPGNTALYPLIFWFATKPHLVAPPVVQQFRMTGVGGPADAVEIGPGQFVGITMPELRAGAGTIPLGVVTTEKKLCFTYEHSHEVVADFLRTYCDEAYGLKATSLRRAEVRRHEKHDEREAARKDALNLKKPWEFQQELARRLHAYMAKVWTPEGIHDRVRKLTNAINSEYRITFEEFLEAKTGVARQKQAQKLRDLMILSKDIIRAVTLLSARNSSKEKKAEAANTLGYARTRIAQMRGLR